MGLSLPPFDTRACTTWRPFMCMHSCPLFLWHPGVYYVTPILVERLASPSFGTPMCTTCRHFMCRYVFPPPFRTPVCTTWYQVLCRDYRPPSFAHHCFTGRKPHHAWMVAATLLAKAILRGKSVLLAFSGVGHKHGWAHHPHRTKSLQVSGISMSLLHWGGGGQEGTKAEVATSNLPSQGPTSGGSCYLTPSISGFPTSRDKT